MHLEYQVRLPDRTFSVGNKHELIPSVIGLCTITPYKLREALDYSGPTYIGIRSMEHDTSTHAKDFHSAIELKCFKDHMLNKDGNVNPILLFATDGGADGNPRFPGTLSAAVARFNELDLDVHILHTNTPGYSTYNRVERRMTPLSKELTGLILPHDSVGSQLDDSGKHLTKTWKNNILEKLERSLLRCGLILSSIRTQFLQNFWKTPKSIQRTQMRIGLQSM